VATSLAPDRTYCATEADAALAAWNTCITTATGTRMPDHPIVVQPNEPEYSARTADH